MDLLVESGGREQMFQLSRCLQEELEATLRAAFEVARERALDEIGRVMARALGDVRAQVRETQRENDSLKLRLHQLHAARNGTQHAAEADKSQSAADSLSEDTVKSAFSKQESRERVAESAQMKYDHVISGSFSEICEDGRVRSHEMSPSSSNEQDTSESQKGPKTDHTQDLKLSDHYPSSFQPGLEHAKVKTERPEPEEPEPDDSSGCDSDSSPEFSFDPSSNEDFGLDRIALVQSKLLEDWRPDPEHLHDETEPLNQGPSHSLDPSEISLISSGCVFPMSPPFHRLYQSADKTSLIHSTQNSSDQMRTNVQSGLYVCKFCGHAFHSGSDLRNHQIQHHKTILMRVGKGAIVARHRKPQLFPPGCSTYRCNVCGREFNRLENLKTHLRIHTGERPYACSVCGVRFRHSGALKRHFRIHTGEKPYICTECGKSFRNCGGLRFHQKSHSQAVHGLST